MELRILSVAAMFAAGCATAGATPEFSGTGVGAVSDGVECVTEELSEDGWTIGAVNDAGRVRADFGAHWLEATILPTTELTSSYLLTVRTSDTDFATDAAADLITDCSA